MSANETYKYILRCEFYDNNQTEVIAFDVEYIMLIANIIDGVEGFLYVGKTMPFCFLGFFEPIIKGCFCLWVLGVILNQFLFGNDSHAVFCLTPQIYNKYSKNQNNLTKIVRLFWLNKLCLYWKESLRHPKHPLPANTAVLLIQ